MRYALCGIIHTPQGETIEGNAADDILMVDQGAETDLESFAPWAGIPSLLRLTMISSFLYSVLFISFHVNGFKVLMNYPAQVVRVSK